MAGTQVFPQIAERPRRLREQARGVAKPDERFDMSENTANLDAALCALHAGQAHLQDAFLAGQIAAVNLSESRGARATELTNGIADCLKHCDRMIVVVEGDLRASRAGL